MRRPIGYGMLVFWVAVAASLQVFLLASIGALTPDAAGSSGGSFRSLAPDLVTVLLVATVGRLDRRDTMTICLFVALGRVAFTSSPPMAVLAGSIATGFLADALRGYAELERPMLRIVCAGLGALAYGSWLLFVDFVSSREAALSGGLAFGWPSRSTLSAPIITAFATAACALFVWPLFARLPGLKRLERRAF